ncbi:hypothetical protein EB796_014319 [Bugula neritina]|uniref:Uncharacterized protein n=1 Tax=Bugula neritina TaxID=10212 RepID=A0A7J7JPN8_BUGNE|nr:hypothetical protein EB796_014319 [Bugula neritina]
MLRLEGQFQTIDSIPLLLQAKINFCPVNGSADKAVATLNTSPLSVTSTAASPAKRVTLSILLRSDTSFLVSQSCHL